MGNCTEFPWITYNKNPPFSWKSSHFECRCQHYISYPFVFTSLSINWEPRGRYLWNGICCRLIWRRRRTSLRSLTSSYLSLRAPSALVAAQLCLLWIRTQTHWSMVSTIIFLYQMRSHVRSLIFCLYVESCSSLPGYQTPSCHRRGNPRFAARWLLSHRCSCDWLAIPDQNSLVFFNRNTINLIFLNWETSAWEGPEPSI